MTANPAILASRTEDLIIDIKANFSCDGYLFYYLDNFPNNGCNYNDDGDDDDCGDSWQSILQEMSLPAGRTAYIIISTYDNDYSYSEMQNCHGLIRIAKTGCGNGIRDLERGADGYPIWYGDSYHGEECDDGNNIDGDGCSSDCKSEYGRCEAWCWEGFTKLMCPCYDGECLSANQLIEPEKRCATSGG